ncbi:MAG TPA: FemAB family XrtA/PEP-CTERM system-associated protein [Allosphingosinicella sp.]|nr:FemAB family XrtA/PEP-CTERM system-associated protein [Allosphingosinicella sp.]
MTLHRPIATAAVRTADLGDPTERARIDCYVAEHPESVFFHRPQWSLAVERGCGQRAHYLVAERPGGALAGCLPLTDVRSALFGRALVSTGFGTGGGVIADDRAAEAALLGAAAGLADRLGCPALELRGGRFPEDYAVRDDVYVGFAMDLPEGEEAILRSIKRRHRGVRRARALDLGVRIGAGPRDRSDFFRVYGESTRNLGSPVFSRRLFDSMLDLFGEEADIVTVFNGAEPVASVLNFYFKGTVHPYWGGGTTAARDCFASELMYFETMCHASRRGCTRFDFGRSKVGSGNHSFKMNWGMEPEPLRYGIRTAPGAAPRDINPLSPKNRLKVEAWKRLPLWAANRLGPLLARGLG